MNRWSISTTRPARMGRPMGCHSGAIDARSPTRRHIGRGLRPSLGCAVLLGALPTALQRDETNGTTEGGHVTDVDPEAFVAERADSTARTAHDVGGGLEPDLELVKESAAAGTQNSGSP